ncbi:MAG TPA: M48 family metalloprotease [Burkholderiales bacterium]|jgi:predicted Zn-dependent protease
MRHSLLLVLALLASAAAAAETPEQRADAEIDDMRAYRLVSRDAHATARIERIFNKVALTAGTPPRFRVLVANSPAFANAESHANGVIVITEEFARFPEADIAFVLAHELAHQFYGHPRQQTLLSEQLRGRESASSFQLRVAFGQLPQEVMDRIRGNETDADRLACNWVIDAGYDFDGRAFFQRMKKQPSANPGGSPSHPSYAQRVSDLETRGCAK